MRRIPLPRPHQLVLSLGVLASLGALASGIVPRLTGWEDDSPISRHVFDNVPDPLYWAFYATVGVMLLVVAWLISQRVQNYERGKPDDRRTTRANAKQRLEGFRSGVWMQTLLRDPAAGVMHSMIYFGFIVLFVATVILEIDHQLPDSAKFLHGRVYQGYAATADVFGVIFVAGIVWALGRRYIQRPYRIRIKTKPEDALILGTFLVIGLTGFATEGLRIALDGTQSFERWSLVGYPLATLFDGLVQRARCSDTHRWLWGIHAAAFVAFLVILPTTKLRHMITSPMNMYLGPRDRPKGAMSPLPNLMETDLDTFGAVDGRGLHLEAAVRHRRMHDLRPVHVGVPCARHRQAPRSARDRAEGGRGDGGHR